MNTNHKRRSVVAKCAMSIVLVVAVLCSTIGAAPVVTKAAETYPYAYTIRNFLSDYQYVAKGDMTLANHTVGGVVSGGNISLGTFGEAMVMPSYARHVVRTGDLNATKYEGIPAGYASNTFYYETMAQDAIPGYMRDKFVQGKFVDVNEAFENICSESVQMAQEPAATPERVGNTIVVDFSKADHYKIDASMLQRGGMDMVDIVGIQSVDDFTKREYRISFTGIGDQTVFFDYMWTSNTMYDYFVRFTLNGACFEQVMKQISFENYSGSQYVNAGMKLITNLPDARRVSMNGLSGHFVAPRANVSIDGGGIEGGVIAESLYVNAEGHFYPYNPVGAPRDVAVAAAAPLEIVETNVDKAIVIVNQTIVVDMIKDQDGKFVVVNTENADFQWQVKNPVTGVWTNISGAVTPELVPGEELEGKEIRCEVTGKNGYVGVVYDNSIVRALPPIEKAKTDVTITIEAEDDFEYELRDPEGTVVIPWVKPEGRDSITFTELTPDTEYKVVKRTPGEPRTESDPTTIRTTVSDRRDVPAPIMVTAPPVMETAAPAQETATPVPATAAPATAAPATAAPVQETAAPVQPEESAQEPERVSKNSVELKIPTIVMKKVMGHKMKFKIKLLNLKGAKVSCESKNTKIATINKKGLVKTKKKNGKCKLVINVTKGSRRIQYVVKLVVRKNCKKNFSLYKYKTTYKDPSVSLYKLVPRDKKYKIKLLHIDKDAKVVYKSSNKKVATVSKKGKVIPKKNGRADVTITITQNGVKYRYFVVVRVTENDVESNTSYLKVIK